MTTVAEQLNPTHTSNLAWELDQINEVIPAVVHATSHTFNGLPYRAMTSLLREKVRRHKSTGIKYAVLTDEGLAARSASGYSKEEAIVHLNPYGNGLTDNMLLRAEYLRQAFKNLGITDPKGDYLPVITLAAPSWRSGLKLNALRLAMLKEGYLAHATNEYLKVVREQNIGRLALIGFSQGASLAAPAGTQAEFAGLDLTRLIMGDPANVIKRQPASLRRAFNSEFKHLKQDYTEPGIKHFIEAHEKDENLLKYAFGIVRRARVNNALFKGLAEDHFSSDLHVATWNNIISTVGYGSLSAITPRDEIEGAIKRSQEGITSGYDYVHSVMIDGAHHSWGDRVDLLATFYGYGLTRPVTEPTA